MKHSEQIIHIKDFLHQNNFSQKEDLIVQALTHKSLANETDQKEHHNQRLEFLGDTVLGMLIARYFFQHFPDWNEGKLTKIKAQTVCEPTLAEVGREIGIPKMLLMGKGEVHTGGFNRDSNIADAVEALLGAIYLGFGLEKTEEFVYQYWKKYLEESEFAETSLDFKSTLQEILVSKTHNRPQYQVIETVGPDHAKQFIIGMFIRGEEVIRSSGTSRKKAEQKAAQAYLKKNGWLKN